MHKIQPHFSLKMLQFLDAEGQLVQPLPPYLSSSDLKHLYQQMSYVRLFDKKAVNLQRIGKMGTYPAALGQEAIGVGLGFAMNKTDVLCPYYRDQATLLQRGVDPVEILSFWGGDERGHDFKNNREDFPIAIPIATQCLHAAGVAYAMQYRNEPRAVVTCIGEGGTSKGDFYEALNVAGAWKLPLVFVVNNNQWAISVHRSIQTGAQTIAQKAVAAGFEGVQIDGNDVVAVVAAVKEALEQARAGGGPCLIECISYRLCDHTTADDASRYRNEAEYQAAWQKEPLKRLSHYLKSQSLWSDEEEVAWHLTCQQKIESAAQAFLNLAPAPATHIIDYTFESLSPAFRDQKDMIIRKSHGF